jgi:hypothetical protein
LAKIIDKKWVLFISFTKNKCQQLQWSQKNITDLLEVSKNNNDIKGNCKLILM